MNDFRFVEHLPDLIQPEDYPNHQDGRLVRLRVSVSADGVEILGDAFRPEILEEILSGLGPDDIQQMLCG